MTNKKLLTYTRGVIFTWHVAAAAAGTVTEAKLSFLQFGRIPEHMEFVPPPAVVPQTHDPP